MKAFATFIILTTISLNIMAQQKIVQTAGRTQLGEFAPEFVHLNDDILFGEVWSRNDSFKCHIKIVFNKSLYLEIHCSAL